MCGATIDVLLVWHCQSAIRMGLAHFLLTNPYEDSAWMSKMLGVLIQIQRLLIQQSGSKTFLSQNDKGVDTNYRTLESHTWACLPAQLDVWMNKV